MNELIIKILWMYVTTLSIGAPLIRFIKLCRSQNINGVSIGFYFADIQRLLIFSLLSYYVIKDMKLTLLYSIVLVITITSLFLILKFKKQFNNN